MEFQLFSGSLQFVEETSCFAIFKFIMEFFYIQGESEKVKFDPDFDEIHSASKVA